MKQKVAIITGIGKSTAFVLARQGVKVVISGRREEVGHQTVTEIQAAGGDAAFVTADVSKEDDVRKMVEFATDKYGC